MLRGRLRTLFLVLGLLPQQVSATHDSILSAVNAENTNASALESIVYGAVVGSMVAVAASLVQPEDRTYLSAFFISAGSLGGLGHYLLQPAPPRARENTWHQPPRPVGVMANIFSWNF